MPDVSIPIDTLLAVIRQNRDAAEQQHAADIAMRDALIADLRKQIADLEGDDGQPPLEGKPPPQ